jgi:twitching motility two-component system response regulator PilG
MQGNLNEIDIRSILQLIELGQRTGQLFVEAYSTPTISIASNTGNQGLLRNFQSPKEQSWFVFFLNGQIVYATDSDSSLSRLGGYLRRYRLETSLDRIAASSLVDRNAPEYTNLWVLLENHILSPSQGRSIIQSIVHETLFDLLGLHQGSFIFEQSSALSPQLTTLKISYLVTKIMQQVQEWKQLHPHIQSPNQYLAIADYNRLGQVLPTATFDYLKSCLDGKTSLRQLARYLNRDILTVGRAMYPFVKQGWIQMLNPVITATPTPTADLQLLSVAKMPRIVCIDDAIAICEVIESILKPQGYEVVSCSNPLQAFSLIFQFKPDLIFCDIAMPELDGYELCAMLRHSSKFRQTPIVMLTGKEQFIDRVKARMLGATDYLTKPFTECELLMLVEKHLHLNNINFAQQKYVTTT